jgi:release factor glutamine methyltransferase
MSRAEAQRRVRLAFEAAGLDTPALDARILLTEALGLAPADLVTSPEAPLGPAGAARLGDYASRRLAREPVARILGEREFWGLPFSLSPETLVPRPDSETVVKAALAQVADRAAPLRLLDLGTGSGCLLVALLHELPNAFGVGLDRSVGALATARRNAARNGVEGRAGFLCSDWAAPLAGSFDLVVSNPPYIESCKVVALDSEVREHDPLLALDGGPDGLDGFRTVFRDACALLADGGAFVVEFGLGQQADIRRIAAEAGFQTVQKMMQVFDDLGGRPRAAVLRKSWRGHA